jgi:hypothetical protein
MKMDRGTRLAIEEKLEILAWMLRRDLLGSELDLVDGVREAPAVYETRRVVARKEVAPSRLARLFQWIAS